jgi:hypothetical protein
MKGYPFAQKERGIRKEEIVQHPKMLTQSWADFMSERSGD